MRLVLYKMLVKSGFRIQVKTKGYQTQGASGSYITKNTHRRRYVNGEDKNECGEGESDER